MSKEQIIVYCDGACRGNPGKGGWGAILLYKDQSKELYGFAPETTNNKMELTAAIEALKSIKNKDIPIKLYSDSKYLQQGITTWIHKWKTNSWNKGKVKNVELWQTLDELSSTMNIEWHWVKGHAGNKYNEHADMLANKAIDEALQ